MRDNVVNLSSRRKASAFMENGFLRSECNHDDIVVDVSGRHIFCARCNMEIDPFDFLMQFAEQKRVVKFGHET